MKLDLARDTEWEGETTGRRIQSAGNLRMEYFVVALAPTSTPNTNTNPYLNLRKN